MLQARGAGHPQLTPGLCSAAGARGLGHTCSRARRPHVGVRCLGLPCQPPELGAPQMSFRGEWPGQRGAQGPKAWAGPPPQLLPGLDGGCCLASAFSGRHVPETSRCPSRGSCASCPSTVVSSEGRTECEASHTWPCPQCGRGHSPLGPSNTTFLQTGWDSTDVISLKQERQP